MILSKMNPNERFSFRAFPHNEILNQIKSLDTEKAIQQNDIPAKL